MVYIPSARAVFIHNPKAAGTAITVALGHHFPGAVRFWGRGYVSSRDMVYNFAHTPAADLDLLLPRSAGVAFSFGVVRNPYDRFVSAFRHVRAHSGCPQALAPEDFVDRYFTHATLRTDWRLVHFRPQYSFFYAGDRCAVDLVGRYEALGTFITEVEHRLGRPLAVPEMNRGLGEIMTLTDTVVAAVNHYYARDFALFGYSQEACLAPYVSRREGQLYPKYEGLWPEERGLDRTERVMP